MNLRQFKKTKINIIKNLQEEDLLVFRFNLDKINSRNLSNIMKIISRHHHNSITIPDNTSIEELSLNSLIQIRTIIDKKINEMKENI